MSTHLGPSLEMMIRANYGPHSGKRVKAFFGAPRYNPRTDELDEKWVMVELPDGQIGTIEVDALFVPYPDLKDLK